MILYLKTTTDEYELPIAVAESGAELAKTLGIKPQTVYNCISENKCGYYRIETEPAVDEKFQ